VREGGFGKRVQGEELLSRIKQGGAQQQGSELVQRK
jgi:hypothetical protein